MRTLFYVLLLVQLISIVLLFGQCAYILTHLKTKLHGLLFFSCVVTLINNVGYLFEMLSTSKETYVVALKLSYLGRIWIPFALLMFALSLCKINLKPWITYALGSIHFVTYILVMTNEWHSLYYTTRYYNTAGLFPQELYGHGVWYIGYQYVLVLIYAVIGTAAFSYRIYKEKDKTVKKCVGTMLFSMGIEVFFFILGTQEPLYNYDVTMLGYSIASFILCVGLYRYGIMDTMEMGKDFCLEEIPEAVIIISSIGTLDYVNHKAKELICQRFNIDEGEIKYNSKVHEFTRELDDVVDMEDSLTIGDSVFSVEKKLLTQNGVNKGTVYVLEDDTTIYNYMDALREQKEIAEEAKEQAIDASASKSAFLSIVSHEIRTPMNAVVGMTDILLNEDDNLSDKQKLYLSNIKSSGDSLVFIVNDILDLSKIEAGKMDIIDSEYRIRTLVDDIKLLIENRIGNKPVELLVEIDDRVDEVLIGDGLRIRQILINLMNNAVKFTEEGYIKLKIELVSEEDTSQKLRFIVSDTGQGIRGEDLNRLGQAFTQVDTHKNHSKGGTGLGLNISKNFIALMGGQLQVESVYGQGSQFFFTINQGRLDITDERIDDYVNDFVAFTCPEASILLVDDNDMNLMIAQELLKSLGCRVTLAKSGKEAITQAINNEFDLVYMDYYMPKMDGIETAKQLRQLGKCAPIVAVSADNSKEARDRFQNAGIVDFVDKPINVNSLRKSLYKWLPEGLIVHEGR